MASFSDTVLDGSPVLRDGQDLLVPLRVPWYRSLALSTFEDIEIRLNGEAARPELLTLEVNGHSYRLNEIGDLTEEYWFIQDTGYARVPAPDAVSTGAEQVEVSTVLTQRIPYILVGPGQCMVKRTHQSATLEVKPV